MAIYNKLNEYYRSKFGERVLKICVDGGFTCPNRDGSKGIGGCVFCGARGSGEHIKYANIKEQVNKHLESYRGKRANKFIVYFQNFTNTYANVDKLKEIYDCALVSDKIIGIAIATRPDCINKEIVELIASYKDKYFVVVELGLQTADKQIAKNLNLCYSVEDYKKAMALLNSAGIEVVTHMMVGLPNESKASIDKTIDVINSNGTKGIKIHNLYITKDTKIYNMYLNKEVNVLTLEQYLEALEYIITHLRSDIIIHRISGDAPKDMLVAPEWNVRKKLVLNGIEQRLKLNNKYQGCDYETKNMLIK